MDNRKKSILKISGGIGIFSAVSVYTWLIVIMGNNYTSDFSTAVLSGVFAAIGSYVAIQNSIPKDYPISELKKKIIITILVFFGVWASSTVIMTDYFGFNQDNSGFLGFILAAWAAQYYAYGRQARLKKREKEAKAKIAAAEAKIAQETEKKEIAAQKRKRRKAWLVDLENDLI